MESYTVPRAAATAAMAGLRGPARSQRPLGRSQVGKGRRYLLLVLRIRPPRLQSQREVAHVFLLLLFLLHLLIFLQLLVVVLEAAPQTAQAALRLQLRGPRAGAAGSARLGQGRRALLTGRGRRCEGGRRDGRRRRHGRGSLGLGGATVFRGVRLSLFHGGGRKPGEVSARRCGQLAREENTSNPLSVPMRRRRRFAGASGKCGLPRDCLGEAELLRWGRGLWAAP